MGRRLHIREIYKLPILNNGGQEKFYLIYFLALAIHRFFLTLVFSAFNSIILFPIQRIHLKFSSTILAIVWYGGGNSTSAEEVLQIPASLP